MGSKRQETYWDKGTAARFFPQFDWQLERLEAEAPFRYVAKASRKERDAGLDSMMKLRDDLTQEQRQYVLKELERLGINEA